MFPHVTSMEREYDLLDYTWYYRSKVLLNVVPPILILIGTVGNSLSFLVLMRCAMRNVGAYNYLAALSVADTLVLYIGLLRMWIGQMTGYDVKNESDVACKVINVVNYTVSDYSVWLLIAVTVERYIVTVHALHSKSMCTKSRARIVMLAIFILLLLVNSHFLFTTEVQHMSGPLDSECNGAEGFQVLAEKVWPWVDAAIYSFVPFIVIITLNVRIICQVSRAVKRRQGLLHVTESYESALPLKTSSTSASVRHSASENSTRITVMLLTISFTFLLTTLPMNVTMIVTSFAASDASMEQAVKFKFARTVTELLMYTNHSINFFLYLLTGHKFRQQLAAMFRVRRRPISRSYSDVEKTNQTELNTLKPPPLSCRVTYAHG